MTPDPQDVSRRQGISYSSNIVHLTGKSPEESAQSTVNVNFNMPSEKAVRQVVHHTPSYPRFLPKTPTDGFQHQRKPFLQQKPKEELLPSSDTQSFNVGYSVRFANNKNPHQQQKFSRPPQVTENTDIITGTRKGHEYVQKPAFPTQELSSNSLLDTSRHIPQNIIHSNLLPLQPKYYDTSENTYEPQTDVNEHSNPWHNLSPSVEIFKSADLSENQSPLGVEDFKPSHQFDHAKALGKSEGFDYSNAINTGADKHYTPQGENHIQQPRQKINAAGPVLFENTGSVSNRFNKQQPHFLRIPSAAYLQHSDSLREQTSLIGANNAPKFPIDTRLLRNPVLTTTKERTLENDPQTIPIHLDTSLIREAMNKEILALSQKNHANQFHVPANNEQVTPTYESTKQEVLFAEQHQDQPLKIYRNPPQVEKPESFKRHKEEYVLRHPRQNRFTVKRPDRNIQFHLRPPPVATSYQRRVFRRTSV